MASTKRPDRQLPVAHVQRDADGGPELVLVAAEQFLGGDANAARIVGEAIDDHGLGHDAAEVLPMRHADGEPLGVGLLGIGDLEVCQCARLPLRVDARR